MNSKSELDLDNLNWFVKNFINKKIKEIFLMPELPEVEVIVRALNKQIINR
ncbi:hypothetical protein H7686_0001835 [Candidatus Phytoplasma asiaticum]|uniref:Formamidopyrimidine-DNA glycosylase catalytic domain-containing protein n=1 Tax=Candidatus Phytoplasma asiaticum TaxID=2763338 RepID=A0AAX3B8S5_9MOLU|nr:hypothetical protein H7686_0001835 ['Parthenium hysterophorus' phyllody phytoplasma]